MNKLLEIKKKNIGIKEKDAILRLMELDKSIKIEYEDSIKEDVKEDIQKEIIKEEIKEEVKEKIKEDIQEDIQEQKIEDKEIIFVDDHDTRGCKKDLNDTKNRLKYYAEKNKEYLKQNVKCPVCDKTMTRSAVSRHKASAKHIANVESMKRDKITKIVNFMLDLQREEKEEEKIEIK